MVKASKFVASEPLLSLALDVGGSTALTGASENAADAFANLLNGDRRRPFFSPPGFGDQEPGGDER